MSNDRIKEKFEELMKEISQEEPKDVTVSGHYGVKYDDFQKWKQHMLADLHLNQRKSDVLDKWFSELKAEDRAKIFAFACAIKFFKPIP